MPAAYSTTYCIYRLVNFRNGKVYVGQTNNANVRKRDHFKLLKYQIHHNEHLQRAYNKYGKDAFYFEVLESGIAETDVDQREMYWIAHFDSFRTGYNKTIGGMGAKGWGSPCEWNGVSYPSIADAAEANGLQKATLWKRLKDGHVCDNDVAIHHSGKPSVWNGISYPSVTQAAKANGVSQSQMRQYLNAGFICDEDIVHKKTPCVWNDVKYSSRTELAELLGISTRAVSARLKKGYTRDEDLIGSNMNARRKGNHG